MTSPVVQFPDAAAVAIGYLTEAFAEYDIDVPVHHKVPEVRPARFVTIVRGGGPRASLVVDRPTLMVEAWAETDADAEDLAQQSRALLHAMRGLTHGGTAIYRIDEFSGPATLPDPDSGQARSVFTLSLLMRGHDLTTA